ncbi:unnamed protein product [Schistosoma margrebowiei]|uniref:Uncharacterized protein n=1 Tax=Schistosoma margrebowiei TaxID=48269 RepID=A0AA84ZCQ0_9TREM|nr:unnamed protein product [Schistosoma margrebowiei]
MYKKMVEAEHSLVKVYANPEVKAETAKYEHAFIKYLSELRNQKNERNFNQTKYCSQTVLIKILSTFSLTEKPKNSINVHFIPVSFR